MNLRIHVIGTLGTLLLSIGCTDLGSSDRSALSGADASTDAAGCTLTQGFWKNHPDAWPVSSLELGVRVYTKAELRAILAAPVKGNGLIQLAHQLIAAKLNIAAGASDAEIASVILEADLRIDLLIVPPIGEDHVATQLTSALNDALDDFNKGKSGPGHCHDNPPPGGGGDDGDDGDDCADEDDDGHADCDEPACGDGSVDEGETCDDGNTTDGDGCSAVCLCEHEEPTPVCGNHALEPGELCDDGNVLDGDGCSAMCLLEIPVCGDGVVEGDEECDDGNLTDGDGCTSACVCEPGYS